MPATKLLFKDDRANGDDRPGVTLALKVADIKSKAIDEIVDPSTNTSVHGEDINSWALLSIAPKDSRTQFPIQFSLADELDILPGFPKNLRYLASRKPILNLVSLGDVLFP